MLSKISLLHWKLFPAVLDIESLETKRKEKNLPKVESCLHFKVMVL
jgi:hypothetical protein